MFVHPFRVDSADIDENLDITNPVRLVEILALRKSEACAERNQGALLIAADTVVEKNGTIMGKPADNREARAMLEALSGGRHTVYTGICLMDTANDRVVVSHEATNVWFMDLGEREILRCLEGGQALDKAGAYAVQGSAGVFIRRIEGCYYNVVGLPVNKLYSMLAELDEIY